MSKSIWCRFSESFTAHFPRYSYPSPGDWKEVCSRSSSSVLRATAWGEGLVRERRGCPSESWFHPWPVRLSFDHEIVRVVSEAVGGPPTRARAAGSTPSQAGPLGSVRTAPRSGSRYPLPPERRTPWPPGHRGAKRCGRPEPTGRSTSEPSPTAIA